MAAGSLGLRSSSSYGNLLKNNNNDSSNGSAARRSSGFYVSGKMGAKEKEGLFKNWIFKKFVLRKKKVGMMLLCVVSLVALVCVLYVGKGLFYVGKGEVASEVGAINENSILVYAPLHVDEDQNKEHNSSALKDDGIIIARHPPPPKYFTGYTLPPGNPCENFAMPPPPADKKRTGPRPCPVCYLPVEEAISRMPGDPSYSPVLHNLTYIHEENLNRSEFGGSEFGGYPSLRQRMDSYDIRESMSVHCGFVKGDRPGRRTGFDIDDSDLNVMDQCQGVVVASAIFGAYDLIQQPKNISDYAKKNVCFFMFVDEETYRFLRNSSDLDSSNRLGLWRIVVIRNLPYSDPRRNGKIPKLLLHRLFPYARYSLWIDAKLELVVDPYQILERFLWRKNASFAISRHYRRFDVFVEAEANKAAGKYDNASIDFQIDFYKNEGLTPYSEAKLPITSDVPEGCVVIREHIPISNLFTCLWFNEVDRFTSRDQLSFSTVRDKIMSKTNWTINMFWDCERRNFVIQGYHRDVLEHWAPPPPPDVISAIHPPPLPADETRTRSSDTPVENMTSSSSKKIPPRRGRDRKSGSKRHRKVAAGTRETSQN